MKKTTIYFIAALLLVTLVASSNLSTCPNWDDYWLNQASSGNCGKICEVENMLYVLNNAEECICMTIIQDANNKLTELETKPAREYSLTDKGVYDNCKK